jgi:hypothetical protein
MIKPLLRYGLLLALTCEGHPQNPTFSSEVKVVSLLATVHDRSGGVVKNLTKDDFRLEEDGQPQIIQYFSRERLARETGGGFWEVSEDNPIDQIYAQIEDELRNQYSIGYTPTRVDTSGKYRKLKLTTVQRGLVVRTRDGYYPK